MTSSYSVLRAIKVLQVKIPVLTTESSFTCTFVAFRELNSVDNTYPVLREGMNLVNLTMKVHRGHTRSSAVRKAVRLQRRHTDYSYSALHKCYRHNEQSKHIYNIIKTRHYKRMSLITNRAVQTKNILSEYYYYG